MISIYGLHNGDGKVRYVGQTSNRERRLKQICCLSGSGNRGRGSMLDFWVKMNSGKVQMKLLDKCKDEEKANQKEREHISKFWLAGNCLVNMEEGGRDHKREVPCVQLQRMFDRWTENGGFDPTEMAFLQEKLRQAILDRNRLLRNSKKKKKLRRERR